MFVFRMVLRTSSDFFPCAALSDWFVAYNRDGVCLLRGTN
jgi:hypothetical protein